MSFFPHFIHRPVPVQNALSQSQNTLILIIARGNFRKHPICTSLTPSQCGARRTLAPQGAIFDASE